MTRSKERIIDAFVLMMLLIFAYLLREEQPALAGVIVMASLKFWMDKNASAPETSKEEKAAQAAASVLEVARKQAEYEHEKNQVPQAVEIVGQADVVDVSIKDKE